MKKLITTVTAWIREYKDELIRALVDIAVALVKIGLVIAVVIALSILAPMLWAAAAGDYVMEGKLIGVTVFSLGALVIFYEILKLTRSRGVRTVYDSLNSASLPLDHDVEILATVARNVARRAIVADALSFKLRFVSTHLSPNGGWSHLSFDTPNGLAPADRLWGEALVSLASLGAADGLRTNADNPLPLLLQLIAAGEKPASVDSELNLSDLVTEAVQQCNELLNTHHEAINRFAAELVEHRMFESDELAEIMDRVRSTQSEGSR